MNKETQEFTFDEERLNKFAAWADENPQCTFIEAVEACREMGATAESDIRDLLLFVICSEEKHDRILSWLAEIPVLENLLFWGLTLQALLRINLEIQVHSHNL